MRQYSNLLARVLTGESRDDRTGVGTVSIFGASCVYDLQQGFPLVTTKKVNFKAVVAELLWFLTGSQNIKDLNSGIWDSWAEEDGNVGPIYGAQWRNWGGSYGEGVDQLGNAIATLRENPDSRRIIVSAWNVSELDLMALPPCPCFFQFYVRDKVFLDMQMYQRSCDMMIGVPFDIASYSLLTMMVAQEVGLLPGKFHHILGDAHVYKNHLEQARMQLTRKPFPLPTLRLNPDVSIFEMTPEDIILENYEAHPSISLPLAV